MSEDIDIEEHDLLQHPGLRSVFPDLSLVKQEPADYVDEIEEFPDEEFIEHQEKISEDQQPDAADFPTQAHVGEKPDSTTDLILAHNSHKSPSDSPLVTSSQSLHASRLSSPIDTPASESDKTPDRRAHEDRCFQSQVLLEDWGKFLEDSKCYCSECLILFATENAFAAHNMSDHSYLTVVARSEVESVDQVFGSKKDLVYTCEKCPAKFNRMYNLNKHKIIVHSETSGGASLKEERTDTAPQEKEKTQEHLCQVCNTSLPTKEELIGHLYNHVGHKCDFCNALFSQKSLLEKHLWTHAKSRHSSGSSKEKAQSSSSAVPANEPVAEKVVSNKIVLASKSVLPLESSEAAFKRNFLNDSAHVSFKKRNKDEKFTCWLCLQIFADSYRLAKHMHIHHRHRVTNIPDRWRGTKVDTHCRLCKVDFGTGPKLNQHIRLTHLEYRCRKCKKSMVGMRVIIHHEKFCLHKVKSTKNIQKLGVPKLKPSNMKVQYLYKCSLCNISFQSYKQGYKHRYKIHPDITDRVIFRDVQKMILKKASAVKESTSVPKLRQTGRLLGSIVIDTVFRCSKCECCFINWRNLKLHATGNCRLATARCDQCGHKFAKQSLSNHKRQHTWCGKKIQVIDHDYFLKNNNKVLLYCCDCDVCYMSQASLKSHNIVSRVACKICHYKFSERMIKHHMEIHKKYNFTAKDFKVVRFSHRKKNYKQTNKITSPKNISPSPKKIAPIKKNTPASPKKIAVPKKLPVSHKKIPASPKKFTANQLAGIAKIKLRWSMNDRRLLQCHVCKKLTHKRHSTMAKNCKKTKSSVCSQCGLIFTLKSIKRHLQQHALSKVAITMNDFTITSSKDNKPVKMDVPTAMAQMHSCRCGVLAHKLSLLCKSNECGKDKAKCSICNLSFVSNTYAWHLKFHKQELQHHGKSVSTVPRNNYKYVRCGICKLHVIEQALKKHTAIDCRELRPYVCEECGLTLTKGGRKLHKHLHRQSAVKLTFDSFQIVRLSDRKPVQKEVCTFPTCKKCGLNTVGHFDKHNKDCDNDTPLYCKKCKISFSEMAFKLHLPYNGCSLNHKSTKNETQVSKNNVDHVSEIMEKYNKLEPLWTQLYQCEDCEVILDSYDEVLKHSEEHRGLNYEVAAFVCHVCDLNFDYSSFQRHKEQHFTRPGLDRTRFEVMEFKPSAYKTNTWDLYENAFTGRNVQYVLKQAGPEQHTLYQCGDCKKVCDNRISAYTHVRFDKSCQGLSKDCTHCGLSIEFNCVKSHMLYHTQHPNLSSCSFRIFLFFNINGPASNSIKNEPLPDEVKEEKEWDVLHMHNEDISEPHLPRLYKCLACDLYFATRGKAVQHRDNHQLGHQTKFKSITCSVCGINFCGGTLSDHMTKHHTNVNYELKDYKVISFDIYKPKSTSRRRISKRVTKNKMVVGTSKRELSKLYRCLDCDVHFLTYDTVKQHVEFSGCVPEDRIVCPECGLGFKEEVYRQHWQAHHVDSKCIAEDFAIIEMLSKVLKRKRDIDKKIQLHKCSVCGLHCMSMQVLKVHFAQKDNFDFDTCKVCKLKFGVRAMQIHNLRHHKERQLTLAHFDVTEHERPDDCCANPEPRVYKCTDCNNSFVGYMSAKRHCDYLHKPICPSMVQQCSECGHNFSTVTLARHMAMHHAPGVEKFRVVLLKPRRRLPDPVARNRSETSSEHKNEEVPNNAGVIYLCVECNVGFIYKRPAENHVNNEHKPIKDDLINCSKCKIDFKKRTYISHNIMHSLLGDKPLEVIPITPDNGVPKPKSESDEAFENVEYLDENVDESPESSESAAVDASPAAENGLRAADGATKEVKSTKVCDVKAPPSCTKCKRTFSSDMQRNLHNALECCEESVA